MHLKEFWELWVSFRCCIQQLNKISWSREFLIPRLLRFDQFTFFFFLVVVFIKFKNFFAYLLMILFPLSYYVLEGWIGKIFWPNKNTSWIGRVQGSFSSPRVKWLSGLLVHLMSWGVIDTHTLPISDLSLPSRLCLFYGSRTEHAAV